MAEKKAEIGKVVEKMASLARLRFDPAKLNEIAKKFEAVLEYIDQLNELDTSGIDPMSHAASFKTPLRDDVAKNSGEQNEILANAPARDGGFVKVPKVLEGE